MEFNFDEMLQRKNTNSIKYDGAFKYKKPDDLLPLWIADMDFKSPESVTNSLEEISKRGLFGYSLIDDNYFLALKKWYQKNYSWNLEKEWLLVTPGIIFAMAMAIRALTNEGDAVLIQRPVYYPFTTIIERNKRRLINNALVLEDGHYRIDYEDFENKIIENKVKIFIFCNPHNPVGRVFTKEEIILLADICLKHNVIIIADEIHSDFVYPGFKHVIVSDLDKKYEAITITCTAPTKTFNLAGLQVSNIWIPNLQIRKSVRREIIKTGYDFPSLTGIVACQSAYEGGEEWLCKLKEYLVQNLTFVREFLATHLPDVKLIEPEGTYLVWFDLRGLLLSDEEIERRLIYEAKLWLNNGSMFGEEGAGFQRMNIACPRAILEDALYRFKDALYS